MADKLDGVLSEILADIGDGKNANINDATFPSIDNAAQAETPPETAPSQTENPEATPIETQPTAQPQTQPVQPVVQADVEQAQQVTDVVGKAQNLIAQQNEAIEALKRQLAEKDAVIADQSKKAEKAIEEELEMPTLNIDETLFMDDAQKAAALADYNKKMSEYNSKLIDREVAKAIEPMRQRFEQAEKAANINAVKNVMRNDAKFADFDALEGDIENLIRNDEDLSKLPPAKAYASAYLMAKGMKQSANQPQKSNSELADEIYRNPELMKLIEQKRAEDIDRRQSGMPKLAQSASATPATPNAAPRNLAEARELALKYFG